MAKILCIETATKVCSVALFNDEKLVSLQENKTDRSHAELLTVFVEKILKENNLSVSDLDAIAVSKGPGSYTGLRIGVSAAKGLAYGANIPLISVDTLQSMAFGVVNSDIGQEVINKKALFCPMIDARRMEVYSAFYDINTNKIKEVSADIIEEETYSEILNTQRVLFFGDGSHKCIETLTSENAIFIDDINPSAKDMGVLAFKAFTSNKFEDTAYFEPFYLKDFVAKQPKKKLF